MLGVDPWRDIEVRPMPDAGGKQVDIHVRPGGARAFVYDEHRALTRELVLDEVLTRLRRIRDARAKRVRERRFNVWYGTLTSSITGQELALIMLPDRFDFAAWSLLADLADLPGHLEQSNLGTADVTGGPLARYEHGQITAYVAATVPGASLLAPDLQLRSATVREPERRAPTQWMLPPTGVASRWHTGDSWQDNRVRILDFVWRLKAAGTYGRLAEITEKHFGISVREELGAADNRYGLLRLGFLRTDDLAVPVAVFLRADLPDALKYVVLAHELSHYLLHFPMLYLWALIDDWGRLLPEAAPVFEAAVAQRLDRDALETQADHFASNFLIPPMYDLATVAEIYRETGRSPSAAELAWRFVQPLIPGAVDEPIGWTNLKRMSELAAADLDAVTESPNTVYARVLRATVARVEGHEHDPGQRIANGLDAIQQSFDEIVEIGLSMPNEQARAKLGARIEATAQPALPDDMLPGRFEPLPPNRVRTGQLARAIHLIPARANPMGDVAGLWLDRHHPTEPPLTIDGWRKSIEDDVAVRLYRHEAWQPTQLNT
ncbi:MAG: ImmA/IrrE family metallo-endopeptidase [Thermoleophilaceae bacterium]